jgi:hypothetical protein
VDAYQKKVKNDYDNQITIAYLTAYWHRVERMPKLKDILKQEPKEQTPDQMLAEIKKLNALMGGSTY